jgi:hypothetical protein
MSTERPKEGQTDQWTNMTNIIVAFRNFANPPKNHDIRARKKTQSTTT